MRCLLRILVSMLFAQLVCSTAFAAHRLALVIGNAAYEHTSPLANPEKDARDIAAVLVGQGFNVDLRINIDLKGMKRAVAETARKARSHGRNTVVLFYYAGHGVQVKQSNYLLPIDARIESEGDVEIEGINAASILESLADAAAATNIVVLDACRNNPYRTSFRSPARGLARMDGPPGFLIAFSTDPGKVAADGPHGGNSPYAKALVTQLTRPGLKIEDAFKQVRREVYDVTMGNQVPWETSSLMEDLYLAGGDGSKRLEVKPNEERAAVEPTKNFRPPTHLPTDSAAPNMNERIIRYLQDVFLRDLETYDDRVDYYDSGIVGKDAVLKEKAKYALRWPARTYSLVAGSVHASSIGEGEYAVAFRFTYSVRNGENRRAGSGYQVLRLRTVGQGLVVTAVKASLDR